MDTIKFDSVSAREAHRFHSNTRVRAVEQGPAGGSWLLEGRQPAVGEIHQRSIAVADTIAVISPTDN